MDTFLVANHYGAADLPVLDVIVLLELQLRMAFAVNAPLH